MANLGLYRSRRHNMIAGVMGGIADRYDWNPTLVRVIFVILSISSAGFPGILVYLVLWILLPKKPQSLEHIEQPHIRNLN